MVANRVFDTVNSYSSRLIRVVTVLVDMHLDIAMQEAGWERKRLVSGLILLSIGGGLLGMSLVLLHAIAIWLLYQLGWSWLGAIAAIAAMDFAIGGIFLAAASRKLKGPYMVQTQARLAKTAAALTRNDLPSDAID